MRIVHFLVFVLVVSSLTHAQDFPNPWQDTLTNDSYSDIIIDFSAPASAYDEDTHLVVELEGSVDAPGIYFLTLLDSVYLPVASNHSAYLDEPEYENTSLTYILIMEEGDLQIDSTFSLGTDQQFAQRSIRMVMYYEGDTMRTFFSITFKGIAESAGVSGPGRTPLVSIRMISIGLALVFGGVVFFKYRSEQQKKLNRGVSATSQAGDY